MHYASEEHSHILLSEEFCVSLEKDKKLSRDEELLRKIVRNFDTLDDFGTDKGCYPAGNLEPKGDGWWCLRLRHKNNYWRILFRKADLKNYGITNIFLKKKNKISKRDWDAAKRIAKREGWL